MGAFIPGMEQHNAVNNSDGFSTGSLNNNSNTSANFNNTSNNFSSPSFSQSLNNQQNPNGFNNTNNGFNNQSNTFTNNQVNNNFQKQNTIQNNGFNQQNVNNQINNNTWQLNTQNVPTVNKVSQIPFKAAATNNKVPVFKKMQIDNNIQNMTGAAVKGNNDTANKISKIINIISIVIIVSLIVFIALYVSGVFKKETSKEVEESESVVDVAQQKQEKIITELVNGCNNLSDEGKYGEAIAAEKKTCDDWICFHEDNVICDDSICNIVVDDKAYTRYCSTGKTVVANKYDTQAAINISELCEILTSQPEYNGTFDTSYGYCSNYECSTTAGGKTYTDTCEKNS